jgi:hypothetical protein
MSKEFTKETIPENLEECFKVLRTWATEEQLHEFRSTCTAQYHHGLGRMLRNQWGLWWAPDWPEKHGLEETPIHKFMVELGLHHADDMSGLILDAFQMHLKDMPFDIEAEVKKYQDYWKKVEEAENAKASGKDPSTQGQEVD